MSIFNFRGKTKEETLQGIKDEATRIEEARPRLKQFADLQEEDLKDIPRLLARLKEIDEEFEKRKIMIDKNTYKVLWSDLDSGYIGTCDEYPSLSWFADTQDEAFSGIRNIVAEIEKELEKKTSEEWQQLCNIIVYDPDGWDRQNYKFSWYEEKITRIEFKRRLVYSTCQWTKEYVEKGLWKDGIYEKL